MKHLQPITSSEELGHFLFELVGVRWQVSERPILTMRKVLPSAFSQGYTVPVWLWTTRIFLADAASGQPMAGRELTVQRQLDREPTHDTIIDLFTDYAYLATLIWDPRHSRCIGFRSWMANVDESFASDDEARDKYSRQKADVLAVKALLGAKGFRQLLFAQL